jgi:23S rRNA (adenine2030-N6)-methyltransferase
MNYRHSYHAGGAADIVKHLVLTCLLRALNQKPTPYFYLETHAGAGCYDLKSAEAQQSHEYLTGIARLWRAPTLSPSLDAFRQMIRSINPGELHYYPGSPWFAARLARSEDKLLFCELQPDVYTCLRQNFSHDKRCRCEQREGYASLKAVLPPLQRRGLVFIDPPFENTKEYQCLVEYLQLAYRRWPTGIYAIWYPIKDSRSIQVFYRQLQQLGIAKMLYAELCPWPRDVGGRLNGSGVVIVNPPWKLEEELSGLFAELLLYQQYCAAMIN